MKYLAALALISSLGIGFNAWACDGQNQNDKKDKTVSQSQAVEKTDKATTASAAQNTAPVEKKAPTTK